MPFCLFIAICQLIKVSFRHNHVKFTYSRLGYVQFVTLSLIVANILGFKADFSMSPVAYYNITLQMSLICCCYHYFIENSTMCKRSSLIL